jgi:hypothetical protein
MMAGGASSNQRPDRLMRTACPSEDSTCNARPVHRCAGGGREVTRVPCTLQIARRMHILLSSEGER